MLASRTSLCAPRFGINYGGAPLADIRCRFMGVIRAATSLKMPHMLIPGFHKNATTLRFHVVVVLCDEQVEIRLDHYKFRINTLTSRLKTIEADYKDWVIAKQL